MADPLITISIPPNSPPQPSNSSQLQLDYPSNISPSPQHHSCAVPAADNGVAGASAAEDQQQSEIPADASEAHESIKEAEIDSINGDADAVEVEGREITVVAADRGGVDASELDIFVNNGKANVAEAEKREITEVAAKSGDADAEEAEKREITEVAANSGDADAAEAENREITEVSANSCDGDAAEAEEREKTKFAALAVGSTGTLDAEEREDTEKSEVFADNWDADATAAEERLEEDKAVVVAKINEVDALEAKEGGEAEVAAHHIRVEEVEVDGEVGGVREEGERERRSRNGRYPVRRNVEDCGFYMRTGMCKFGMNCKFNHPPHHPNQSPLGGKVKGIEESMDAAAEKAKERDDSVDKGTRLDCKYFGRPGGCKFGKACKFIHSRKAAPTLELNFMGLPIRPGEKECPYYMRNGSCKYGESCRFNHPDPTSVEGPDALPSFVNGVESISSHDVSHSTLAPWSPSAGLSGNLGYAPMVFPPTQHVPSQSEWNAYQASLYPPEGSLKIGPTYAMNSLSSERNIYAHRQEQILVDEFPERPGQPECAYFLRTGNCKYRSACKYHHPKKSTGNSPSCSLSDLGLPLRPGVSICSYYSRYGICKYGPACKYDHPVNYTHSVAVSSVDLTSGLSNGMVNNHAMAASS